MNKDDLLAIGLTDDQAGKVLESLNGNFVTKSRFNEVNEELKAVRKTVTERDKQLEDLKNAAGDHDALQAQIAELQKMNAEQQKAHDAELARLKLDNAIEVALSGAQAKNAKAVRAMLDMDKVHLTEDGRLSGFAEQIEMLKKSDGYMFQEAKQAKFSGFQPGTSTTVPDSAQASYESRLTAARQSNNSLEVIKIKQEAAADGVVLL